MSSQDDFKAFLDDVEVSTDDTLTVNITQRLRQLEELRERSSNHYEAIKRRLLQLGATTLKDDFNPLQRTESTDISNYRLKLWSPTADLATLTTTCEVTLPVVDYTIALSTFSATSNVVRSDSTRVETPSISTVGLLTWNVVPRIDTTILNDFEVAVCHLKLTTPLLVDGRTWHLLDPCLRRFVLSGITYFPEEVGNVLTPVVLNDYGLSSDVTIMTLGSVKREASTRSFTQKAIAQAYSITKSAVCKIGKGVATVEWPSLSPDLNPIENIWAYLVKQIYGSDKPVIRCKDQLRQRLWAAWTAMPADIIKNCTGSMEERLTVVLLNDGAKTHY
ncbi:hypothetical protein FOL47_005368 [Perkinsus chesapeaki]|uniref:Uncharacterized protein n=1 Tax=Perkinsus chesapeaki TaxID=330153 RepID=A0A7J6N2G2_PERCH|nr:hypothetical protein FOL47_005368 [Perkinsus chesapeaki]